MENRIPKRFKSVVACSCICGLLIAILSLSPNPQVQAAMESEEIAIRTPRNDMTISAGGAHTCMLKSDATLVCFGEQDCIKG